MNGKSKILFAAKKVISEHGTNRATVRAIAEEAGMSTGAIYHYYKNKEEIFYDLLDESLSDSIRIAKGIKNHVENKEKIKRDVIQKTKERFYKDAENRLQHHFAHEILSGNMDLKQKLKEKYKQWNLGIEEILVNLYGLEDTPLNKALSSWLLGAVDGVILQYLLEVNDNKVEDMMKIFELLIDKGLPEFIQLINAMENKKSQGT
ncbi:TetR/AcrR family transcriptional regulator [Fervidibacillus halotolerans]|uniref:TetR/AcrR family transcriptional regulator n=1 Tax=Fervidibacillus halotolerans TaxID=2980027 RepID=A0A9E8M0Q9_9BACI|nr:TetR/AcrR family transcriptional regulator [Fervidibacillus halotolerans]WAA13378.1 TetR/AcrR family transcriptional regulator [Fervidibacillus halotolerans]